MSFDFNQFSDKLIQATRAAFIEIFEKHHLEGICAFALYSDEGAMTVCPSTNTLTYLAGRSGADADSYRFEPAEWKYEMVGADDRFDDLSQQLSEAVLAMEDDDEAVFLAFRSQVYETCIRVLETLKQENFFDNVAGRPVFLTFSVSDSDYDVEERRVIIARLNDTDYQKSHEAWLQTW